MKVWEKKYFQRFASGRKNCFNFFEKQILLKWQKTTFFFFFTSDSILGTLFHRNNSTAFQKDVNVYRIIYSG